MKGFCVIALKMVLINRFKKESLLYYVVKCFFYIRARGLSSYAMLLLTLEKLDKEDLLIEQTMDKLTF
ncbi:hypothetical protein RchiOBHm_Chr4g0384861 [Rosa chinensis]|uniref:Uncharacterized protein n=1 Tax=Rosa chinensis TaxID=74649 RepID=A0A2P6QNS7_ROSCH|nr:hypothetical protein RchiOBHm_Chr4g0384861 [Rosa chinensis]